MATRALGLLALLVGLRRRGHGTGCSVNRGTGLGRHALPGHTGRYDTRVESIRWLRDGAHLRTPGAGMLLLDDHDGSVLGGVETGGVDAREDEEDEVDDPLEPGEDGAGDEDGVAARGLVALLVRGVAVGVVAGVAVVAAPVAVVHGSRDGDGRGEAADDGGGEPDDEGEADVGAGVDALLEAVDGADDELGAAPEDGDASLGCVSDLVHTGEL